MAVKSEQLEYMKFRKALDKALRHQELIKIDYEYDLGKKDVKEDATMLLKNLLDVEEALVNIREMLR